MNIRQRINRLAAAMAKRQAPTASTMPPADDDADADRVGVYLFGHDWSTTADADQVLADPLRQWDAAAKSARAAGHEEYHPGLRPYAFAVWQVLRPAVLEHRRQMGEWQWTDPPTPVETMPADEFAELSYAEQLVLYQQSNRRRGHWVGGAA